jgi:hypothetical protein
MAILLEYITLHVMAALVAAIHVLLAAIKERKTWMPATSAGMTSGES